MATWGQLALAELEEEHNQGQLLTVRPFLSVVVSVLIGPEMGVARPRRKGTDSPEAVRPRSPCARFFRASLRDAIGKGGGIEVCGVEGVDKLPGSLNQKKSSILPHPKGSARERPGHWQALRLVPRDPMSQQIYVVTRSSSSSLLCCTCLEVLVRWIPCKLFCSIPLQLASAWDVLVSVHIMWSCDRLKRPYCRR